MALDRHTSERLAYSHIAEDQRLAQTLRALDRAEEEQQPKQSTGNRWFSRLLRTLATARIPDLTTL